MSLDYDIEVEVSGREHQGKTNLVAYLSKVLTDAGVELIVQRADPQIDEKLGLSLDDLKSKLAGKKIFLREVQTIF
jgi:CO dehydrogenase nickel-insertion accessory protein CooC1